MGNGGVDCAAGVDGVVGDGLEDADDAFCVGDDDEREVVHGKLVEEGGIDDEGGRAAEIVCSIGWSDGRECVGGVGEIVCSVGWRKGSGGRRWGIGWDSLGEEAVEVGFVAGDGEDRGRELDRHADALSAPIGEEEKGGDGVGRGEVGQPAGNVEGRERNRLVRVDGMGWVCKIGERLAEEGVAATGEVDGDGVVRRESGGKSCVESGEGCGDRGWRGFVELLKGWEGDAVGVEIVERLRRLGAGIGGVGGVAGAVSERRARRWGWRARARVRASLV